MRAHALFMPSIAAAVVTLALASACSGGDKGETGREGPSGAAGPQGGPGVGAPGPQGPAGAAGGVTNADGGGFIVLSDRARQGLAIAPARLALGGKTQSQIEAIGIGSYLANALAECTFCHTPSPDKHFAGGVEFAVGTEIKIYSRNLTPDPATGLKASESQFVQSSRNGTDTLNVGKRLLVHPWQHHRWLSDGDLRAVYAYLQVIPPVNNAYPADVKPSLAAVEFPNRYDEGDVERTLPATSEGDAAIPDPDNILRGLAIVPLAVDFPDDPAVLSRFGRGSYIVNAGASCSACHTNPDRDPASPAQKIVTAGYMSGGFVFAANALAPVLGVTRSMSANLIGQENGFFNLPKMSFQIFLTGIVQGVHAAKMLPDGGAPKLAWPMPYRDLRNLLREDLEAIYTYFDWIAKHAPRTGVNDKVTQSAARYCSATAPCAAGETCDAVRSECVGRTCTTDDQCDACQTCPAGSCVAPAQGSACLVSGR